MDILDLTACDREPIHVPGAIQPHGLLLLADATDGRIFASAGDVERLLAVTQWIGRAAADLIGEAAAARLAAVDRGNPAPTWLGAVVGAGGRRLDASAHLGPHGHLIELEPAEDDGRSVGVEIGELETMAAAFEYASSTENLCRLAAAEIRRRTGYGRVMVYRFLDDESGQVISEDCAPGMRTFLNHHFPASDIPRQARALYLRNLVRVIPDIAYTPAPIRFAPGREAVVDLSDAGLRSVSPIHIQYLRNMGVAASASFSIVKDGALWGLVACHDSEPRTIGFAARSMCRAIAGALGRQLKARDDTGSFRERVRLRSFQDDLVSLLSREGSLEDAISNHVEEIRRALGGDGVAILRGEDLLSAGRCPSAGELKALARWALKRGSDQVYATNRLAEDYPAAERFHETGAGLLALTLSVSDPWVILWFRAEEIEIVEWAGNPHKEPSTDPNAILTPRASFESWRETVRGRSRRWTPAEVEAASRLRAAVIEVWQARGLMELNRRMVATLAEKDMAIQQKEFLIGEVNHRVQNSLQLVSSFLSLQARSSNLPGLAEALEEARRRLTAVALVHRRLYRSDQVETVDAARYLDELVADVIASLGAAWAPVVTTDFAPVLLPTDRAVCVGLILTELMINATKYAYGGEAGPLSVTLGEHRASLRLIVADKGVGASAGSKRGFGSRMMDALVRQVGGELEREDNRPGLKVILTAPVARSAD